MIIKDKLKQKVINLFICSLCHFLNITKDPNTVDNPATEEITKGIKKDIKSPDKLYAFTIKNRKISLYKTQI